MRFWKLSGAGNDFVALDNLNGSLDAEESGRSALVRRLCERRTGVGADGVLILEPSARADFRMRYYNADGGEVETCGNGARCIARLACLLGVAGGAMRFETRAGIYEADVRPEWVRLAMGDASGLMLDVALDPAGLPLPENFPAQVDFINTGVPHAVVLLPDVEDAPVVSFGRAIRHHPRFAPAGTNANFAAVTGPNNLRIRTYERGVENETLACGTGSIAAAIIASRRGLVTPPVHLATQSGAILTIDFTPSPGGAQKITLQGEACLVFTGEIPQPLPEP